MAQLSDAYGAFLADLKRTVEINIGARNFISNKKILIAFALTIEKQRMLLRAGEQEEPSMLIELCAEVDGNNELRRALDSLRFDALNARTAVNRDGVVRRAYALEYANTFNSEIKYSALEALSVFRDKFLDGGTADVFDLSGEIPPNQETRLSVQRLRTIVPQQALAPIWFEIESNKIKVVQPPTSEITEHKDFISATHDHLVKDSKKILSELERTNCDTRLIDRVRTFNEALEDDNNPIKIGVMNASTMLVVNQFKDELPDVIFASLIGLHQSVSMYVAQYSEWHDFSEKAASAEMTDQSVKEVVTSARQILIKVQQSPDLVEPEVPLTLKLLIEAIDDPKLASKRAAFALLKSVENLISTAYKFGVDLIEKTISKSINSVSSVASKAVALSFLVLVLDGAVGLSSVSNAVTGSGWVNAATELVKKEITKLQD